MDKITVAALYNLDETLACELLRRVEYPWQALPLIGDFIRELGTQLPPELFDCIGQEIWVAKTAQVSLTATVNGPCIIDEGAEIRHCAFIRGNALVGKEAVVGNSTELKNVILFNRVQVPHYNYVGDSILGYKAHMGAGSITSNVKSDSSLVTIRVGDTVMETGRKKVGAMLGDGVEVGCNTVLSPGTVVGRNTNIYPLSMVRGYVPEGSIYKKEGVIVEKLLDFSSKV
jgi:NDP-sugar pyrophosphorylase family protein